VASDCYFVPKGTSVEKSASVSANDYDSYSRGIDIGSVEKA